MRDFNFENLLVYQKTLNFIDEVYRVTATFPKSEMYGLQSQFKRAANSIALNIAEGHCDTDKQFNRFLNIAQGSIRECIVCVTIAQRQKMLSFEKEKMMKSSLLELAKMISSLKKKLNV